VFADNNESWFSKPFISTPDWAKPDSIAKTPDLGPRGPVGAESLVGADGRCAMAQQTAQAMPPAVAQPPADRPVGSMAGDLAGAPMSPMAAAPPVAEPGAPQVMGGIALGMTECQAVARAGTPGNVAITGGDHGERNVVLTYLSGPWPGIYRFSDGRLKVIDRAPVPPAGFDQIAVMGDHDDRARKFIDRLGQRRAAVDVQMVGRLVENDHVGAEEGRSPAAAGPFRRPTGS
jgi:hypothetical protein